jgi:outer membrane receptor for monomeric catechols
MQEKPIETWRPVLGFEDYYSVSDSGRVRSEPRVVIEPVRGCPRRIRGGVLRSHKNKDGGYLFVSLSRDGVRVVRSVHTLVLEAFRGPAPKGMEGAHNDGNSLNCALSNLRWDTHQANVADQVRHGTQPRGEKHRNAKLTDQQAIAIFLSEERQSVLSERYGVAPSVICGIKAGRGWAAATAELRKHHLENESAELPSHRPRRQRHAAVAGDRQAQRPVA